MAANGTTTLTNTYQQCALWISAGLAPTPVKLMGMPTTIAQGEGDSGFPAVSTQVVYNVVLQANPDIAGVGMLVAFLVTAWVSLIFMIWSYCTGRMPGTFLGEFDQICLKMNSRRWNDKWRATMNKIVLVFSDQQLITGLAIIIAGFLEAYNGYLDLHHWQFVIYLAWTSSTVHLINLSFLKERLSQRPILQWLRIGGMLTLSILLLVALIPQLKYAGIETGSNQNFPVRCFIIVSKLTPEWLNKGTVISYVILCIAFGWKLYQFVPTSHQLIRRWFVATPAYRLETALQILARIPHRSSISDVRRKLLTYIYICLLVVSETSESFIATVLLLSVTLSWGTLQLVIAHRASNPEIRAAEFKPSFGQLPTLFLLLQLLTTIFEYLVEKYYTRGIRLQSTRQFHLLQLPNLRRTFPPVANQLQKQHTIDIIANTPTRSSTSLTDVLKSTTSRSIEDKVKMSKQDPVIEYLYRSKLFRTTIWAWLLVLTGLTITVIVSTSLPTGMSRVAIFIYVMPPAIAAVPIFLACALLLRRLLK